MFHTNRANRSKKILITGFEPFDGGDSNPSQILVENYKNEIEEIEVSKLILPVVFGKALTILKKEAFLLNPDYILCFGLNAKASEINLEVLAHNLDEARIADNEGNKPEGEKIFAEGAATLASTLPIKEMEDALLAAQIPVAISRDCGRYVCNHIFYGIRHIIDEKKMRAKAGFIHLPEFEKVSEGEQARGLAEMLKALS